MPTLKELIEEPYASIICYPRATKLELTKRIRELRKLGVTRLEFTGEKRAFNTPILGKGCVGIVVLAHVNDRKAALKIRRVDADRSTMQREAELLKLANSEEVGPKLIDASENLLLMRFIHGQPFPMWLQKRRARAKAEDVLHDLLEQGWRLDRIGLDHGELSNASKHVIVDGKDEPFIVDFETASTSRRPSNVTSICQFLFLSAGDTAKGIAELLGKRNRRAIVTALKRYKRDRTQDNFEGVLNALEL